MKRRTVRGALAPVLGRWVRALARLRGGGSALPGRVAEVVDPDFVARALGSLPHGVAIVSGTNGKTTTTRIAAALLRGQGLRVFTNATGSNMPQGVASAVLEALGPHARVHADVAVLELDEAYAVRVSEQLHPRWCVLLNVMRDQLDRFGELDRTSALLAAAARATTDAVIANRDDPLVARAARGLAGSVRLRTFGVAPRLRAALPTDADLYGAPRQGEEAPAALPAPRVVLQSLEGPRAAYRMGDWDFTARLRLPGVYNAQNAAAALALADAVCGDGLDRRALVRDLAGVTPAFGRGEVIRVGGRDVELILVKNPGGFRQALAAQRGPATTMLAICDSWADGRDVSWLWDVDFASLRRGGVAVVAGTRAWDMALRLRYDEVGVGRVIEGLPEALGALLASGAGRVRIFSTYTAMLELRHGLARLTHVQAVGVR